MAGDDAFGEVSSHAREAPTDRPTDEAEVLETEKIPSKDTVPKPPKYARSLASFLNSVKTARSGAGEKTDAQKRSGEDLSDAAGKKKKRRLVKAADLAASSPIVDLSLEASVPPPPAEGGIGPFQSVESDFLSEFESINIEHFDFDSDRGAATDLIPAEGTLGQTGEKTDNEAMINELLSDPGEKGGDITRPIDVEQVPAPAEGSFLEKGEIVGQGEDTIFAEKNLTVPPLAGPFPTARQPLYVPQTHECKMSKEEALAPFRPTAFSDSGVMRAGDAALGSEATAAAVTRSVPLLRDEIAVSSLSLHEALSVMEAGAYEVR